jgi:hypothetical protein
LPQSAAWILAPQGENCMVACGGSDKCLEGYWPTSGDDFQKVLEAMGENSCTELGDGDWDANPGIYPEYDNVCYWKTKVSSGQRCDRSHYAVARFCPCKGKPTAAPPKSTTTDKEAGTTTVMPTTTAEPPVPTSSPSQRRRGTRRRRRKNKKGSKRLKKTSRRRRRHKAGRRRKATA